MTEVLKVTAGQMIEALRNASEEDKDEFARLLGVSRQRPGPPLCDPNAVSYHSEGRTAPPRAARF